VCLTCGCDMPLAHHHDPRNIVLGQLLDAARAVEISPEEAAANVPKTLAYAFGNPARAFHTTWTLPTIVFDIDGTLAFMMESALTALNAAFGDDYKTSDITVYDWPLLLPKKQRAWLRDQLTQSDLYENLAPDWRAVDTLLLAQRLGYPVWVCTERNPALHQVTSRWLELWGLSADGLATVGHGNKPAWMRRFDADKPAVLIDDNPAFEYLIPAPGVQLWSPPSPYRPNGEAPPGVTRLASWQQARDQLIDILTRDPADPGTSMP